MPIIVDFAGPRMAETFSFLRKCVSLVQILLTNDDGIYAPGLAALERELQHLGDVCIVAPATEQSGVGHSITLSQARWW